MKIVSLLPSATEIVYALGLGEQLMAVTHECDYPPEATEKPIITASVLDHSDSSSGKIHKGITGLVHEGKSIYHLDEIMLAEIKPDLILTQELCEVCAVSYEIVLDAARIIEGDSEIISLEPKRLEDVLSNILLVGMKTNKLAEAKKQVDEYRQRIDFVATRTQRLSYKPKVYCMEWIDPPFAAGHWIAEMVSLAGGRDELAQSGKPSIQIQWSDILSYAPEILIFMPCGFGLEKSIGEAKQVREWQGWSQIPAVKNSQIYVVDGSSFFNRPGPRLVTGLEILAQIIHSEAFTFPFCKNFYRKLM